MKFITSFGKIGGVALQHGLIISQIGGVALQHGQHPTATGLVYRNKRAQRVLFKIDHLKIFLTVYKIGNIEINWLALLVSIFIYSIFYKYDF